MPRPCVAIYWVANQRMAKMREVHANLMRASGFQIALHGADGWARFVRHCEHPVMGARGLACRAGNNGMLNTVARMASKRGIDSAFLPRKRPKRKGQITALHSARLKLTDQMRIGGQRSRAHPAIVRDGSQPLRIQAQAGADGPELRLFARGRLQSSVAGGCVNNRGTDGPALCPDARPPTREECAQPAARARERERFDYNHSRQSESSSGYASVSVRTYPQENGAGRGCDYDLRMQLSFRQTQRSVHLVR